MPMAATCPTCGAPATPNSRFCGACGSKLESTHSTEPAVSAVPATAVTPTSPTAPAVNTTATPATSQAVGASPTPVPPASLAPAGMRYATFWARVGGSLIDALIRLVLVLAAVLIAVGLTEVVRPLGIAVGIVLFVAAWVFYRPLFWWWKDGQSIGGMAAGTRVLRANGDRMTFWRGVGRSVAEIILIYTGSQITLGILGLLDVLWMTWDKEKQTLHDKMADTIVVYAAGSERQSDSTDSAPPQ